MVGPPGLEPGTDRLWAGCSNQLSYRPMTFDRKSRTAKVMREMQNIVWSGKRDSNSRPPPWQGDALPTELFPHWRWHPESNWGIEVLQTSALPLGYVTDIKLRRWSGKRDSNSRPPPWQGDALPTELFPHHADTREENGDPKGTWTPDLRRDRAAF